MTTVLPRTHVASRTIAVLGVDDSGLAFAAALSQAGHEVVLWEPPRPHRDAAVAHCESRVVKVSGCGGEGVAQLAAVTSDLFAALSVADTLVASVPPSCEAAFASFVLPLVEPRHTLVLPAGRLATLRHATWLRDRGRCTPPTLVESDVAPFVARRVAADHVHVDAMPLTPGFGVFPAERTERAMAVIRDLVPSGRTLPHVLAAGLSGVIPFLRAVALVLNGGGVERIGGAFRLFSDGFTPAVASVAAALDSERVTLGAALDLELPPAAETLAGLGLSPHAELWAAVRGSRVLDRETAAITGEPHLSRCGGADEAVFTVRPWVGLAEQLGVDTPVMKALLTCAAAMASGSTDGDGATGTFPGSSLQDLGIMGMPGEALMSFLQTGCERPAI